MQLVDLTMPAEPLQEGHSTCVLEELPLIAGGRPYTGMVYHFHHDSMLGTYLDIPGHIKETDDGFDSETYPLEKLYRVPAVVAHLDRECGSGRIGADELAAACPDGAAGALVLNALGTKRFDDIKEGSVAIGLDAAEWIAARGFHLLVSDVYETRPQLQGVFNLLFSRGVSTVCQPTNLHLISKPRVSLTVLCARFSAATQLPCRALVEIEE